jgi:hypothetical protein
MAHDGDHGRTGDKILGPVRDVEQALLDVGLRNAAHRVAHFGGNQFGGVGIDHVAGLQDLALLHEELDDVDRPLRHAVGEILDGDRFRQRHLARDLLARLIVHGALELLLPAAHRRERARPRVVAVR